MRMRLKDEHPAVVALDKAFAAMEKHGIVIRLGPYGRVFCCHEGREYELLKAESGREAPDMLPPVFEYKLTFEKDLETLRDAWTSAQRQLDAAEKNLAYAVFVTLPKATSIEWFREHIEIERLVYEQARARRDEARKAMERYGRKWTREPEEDEQGREEYADAVATAAKEDRDDSELDR